jgi:hypothetical protein
LTSNSLEAAPADRRPAAKALGDVIPAQTLTARARRRGATSPPASRSPHPRPKSRPRSGDPATTAPASAHRSPTAPADGSWGLRMDAEHASRQPRTANITPARPTTPTPRQPPAARHSGTLWATLSYLTIPARASHAWFPGTFRKGAPVAASSSTRGRRGQGRASAARGLPLTPPTPVHNRPEGRPPRGCRSWDVPGPLPETTCAKIAVQDTTLTR